MTDNRTVRKLARDIYELQQEQRRLATAARLSLSSIDDGSLELRADGVTRQVIGLQPDGTVTTVDKNGPPPPVPSDPVVTAALASLIVEWDGTFVDDAARPADFTHIEVHVSETPGFEATDVTQMAVISGRSGAVPVAPLVAGTTYYVALVAVSTSKQESAKTAEVTGVPDAAADIGPGSITETEIADDSISTPKLRAEAVTADKIAANSITAGQIQTGSITAEKLSALMVLASRVVSGNPTAARMEINETGLIAYDASGNITVQIESDGTAVFSGETRVTVDDQLLAIQTGPAPDNPFITPMMILNPAVSSLDNGTLWTWWDGNASDRPILSIAPPGKPGAVGSEKTAIQLHSDSPDGTNKGYVNIVGSGASPTQLVLDETASRIFGPTVSGTVLEIRENDAYLSKPLAHLNEVSWPSLGNGATLAGGGQGIAKLTQLADGTVQIQFDVGIQSAFSSGNAIAGGVPTWARAASGKTVRFPGAASAAAASQGTNWHLDINSAGEVRLYCKGTPSTNDNQVWMSCYGTYMPSRI